MFTINHFQTLMFITDIYLDKKKTIMLRKFQVLLPWTRPHIFIDGCNINFYSRVITSIFLKYQDIQPKILSIHSFKPISMIQKEWKIHLPLSSIWKTRMKIRNNSIKLKNDTPNPNKLASFGLIWFRWQEKVGKCIASDSLE